MFTEHKIDITSIMRRALNTLDYRLMDHGWRVGYLVYHLLKNDENYTREQLVKICYTALFHDIGAYKTEKLDSLSHSSDIFQFEIKDTFNHSVYSYLFLNEYEFYKEFSDAVLFHHFTYNKLIETECKNKELASIIFIADRIEILAKKSPNTTPDSLFSVLRNKVFNQDIIKRLEKLEQEEGVITKYIDGSNLAEVLTFLSEIPPTNEQTLALVDMIPHTIDFRSEHTVTHTVATVKISVTLGKLMGLDKRELGSIYIGALLHDIGKISTPLAILEKSGKLTSYEYGIMKDHVVLTDYILNGCLDEEIVRIAARHHEKLDGTGYPKGLKIDELTLSERIVAVADVLSALMGHRSYKNPFTEEKVREIMMAEKDGGKLCAEVIDMAFENYQELKDGVDEVSDKAMKRFINLESEAERLKAKYKLF